MTPPSAIFAAIAAIRPEHAATQSGTGFNAIMAVHDGSPHVAARIC